MRDKRDKRQETKGRRDKGQKTQNQEDKNKRIILNNLFIIVNTPRKRFMGTNSEGHQGTRDKREKGQGTKGRKD